MIVEEIVYKESVYRVPYTGDRSVIEAHNKHILEFDKGRIRSNRGGYQSNDITFGYDELINFIKEVLKKMNIEVGFSNFWLNVNDGTNYNETHIHDLDHISAVYYHRVCCDQSPLVFSDQVPHIRPWEYKITPKEGEILLFDSAMPHAVRGCNNPEHKRVSIAFNFSKL